MHFLKLQVILAGAIVASTAWAAPQKVYDQCNSHDPDVRIPGCTLVIQDAKESQKNRGVAYYLRGLGHELKGNFAEAIADYDQAIKLKHESASKRRDYVIKKKEYIEKATPNLGSLDGTWEGELTYQEKDNEGKAKQTSMRVVINGTDGKVFLTSGGKNDEVKPNAFRVHRHLTNAVVLAIDSALDDEGLWVETWSIVVTLKDRDTLMTTYSRTVNNANLPLSVKHSKFSSVATGEMKRK